MNDAPKRIQLRRTKGWRKPEGCIVCTRPGPWGNPFTLTSALELGFASDGPHARKFVVECFEDWLYKGTLSDWWFANSAEGWAWMRGHLDDLRDRDLGCYCPPGEPCHVDILLMAANR